MSLSPMSLQVSVEDVSAFERKIVVEVPAEDVTRSLDAEFKKLGKQAKVRGFRQGKVPKGLVRKMFRQDAVAAVSRGLVQANIVQAIDQAKIEPISYPQLEQDPIEDGKPFVFRMFVQVKPEFEIEGLGTLSVEPESTEPADEAMQAEIDQLREKHAELEPVEDRGADIGDVCTVDYTGTVKGEEEPFKGGTAQDQDIEIGSGQLIPGFEDQLHGATPESDVVVEVTFPEDYSPELAGKEVIFQVKVRDVRKKVLPVVDDDFARDIGFEDLGAMRADIYDRLAGELRGEVEGKRREVIIAHLIETNPMDVPSALIDQAASSLAEKLGMNLSMSGIDETMLKTLMEGQKEMIRERAVVLAHRDLLLDKVAQTQSLTVTEEALESRLDEIATGAGQPKAKVKGMLQRNGRMEGLREEMLHTMAMEWLDDVALNGLPEVTEPAPEAEETAALEPATEETTVEDSTEAAPEGQATADADQAEEKAE